MFPSWYAYSCETGCGRLVSGMGGPGNPWPSDVASSSSPGSLSLTLLSIPVECRAQGNQPQPVRSVGDGKEPITVCSRVSKNQQDVVRRLMRKHNGDDSMDTSNAKRRERQKNKSYGIELSLTVCSCSKRCIRVTSSYGSCTKPYHQPRLCDDAGVTRRPLNHGPFYPQISNTASSWAVGAYY